MRYPESGTPQGGVISPILANIYLHEVLDTWFEQEVKPRMRGRRVLVRYADDACSCFERRAMRVACWRCCPKRFGEVWPDAASGQDPAGRVSAARPHAAIGQRPGGGPGTFDLLGFTHFWGQSRKGKWIVKRQDSPRPIQSRPDPSLRVVPRAPASTQYGTSTERSWPSCGGTSSTSASPETGRCSRGFATRSCTHGASGSAAARNVGR